MVDENQGERRRSRRIPFIQDAVVEGVGPRRLSDLSLGGVYLESSVSFPVGTEVDIRFKLNEADDREVQVKARVLYIHDGVGMGLSFINLPPEIAEKIKKIVEQQSTF